MERTPFAGLTALDLLEPLSTDGGSFLSRNPLIIDLLLRVGAVAHRHDGHAAMDDPIDAPTVATLDAGGTIESDTAIYVVYTVLDADGGESLPAPLEVVTTRAGLVTPDASPELTLDPTSGSLLAGNYYYAVTVTDGAGGETPLGPPAAITIAPGPAGNTVTIDGLQALAEDVGGTGWRLWRMIDGGDWRRIADGANDQVVDDGTLCPDCTGTPPTTTTRTNATSKLQVTVPDTLPAGAQQIRLYASLDGSFESPAILGTYPAADAGAAKEYASLALLDGAPPEVSLALPGANPISLETDILDNPWKTPVADAAALPAAGNTNGDLRETLDDHTLHIWTGAAWVPFAGGGGGGGGHTIQDENDPALPARSVLAFQGAGVTATDDAANDRTVVTVAGGGGGSGGLPSRETVDFQQAGMTAGDIATPDLVMPQGYRLLKVTANLNCRVELYTTDAARVADAARADGEAPGAPGHGIVIDVDPDGGVPLTFTPAVEGFNDDGPPVDVGYARITAYDTGDIDVQFTVVRTEA